MVTPQTFRYGLNVVKYTWFAQDSYICPQKDFVNKLDVLRETNADVAKRLVFRYLCMAPSIRCPLEYKQAKRFVGECPYGIPLSVLVLNLDGNLISRDCFIPQLTPKLYYVYRFHLLNMVGVRVTSEFDKDMSNARCLMRGKAYMTNIPGTTVLDKVRHISTKPLDVMYLYCGHLITDKTSRAKDLKHVVQAAYMDILSMPPDSKDVHIKAFCLNVFATTLSNLYGNMYDGNLDGHIPQLLSVFDVDQPISPNLSGIVTQLLHQVIRSHSGADMKTVVTSFLKHPERMIVDGGPLIAMVKLCRFTVKASEVLVDLMKDLLSAEERVNILKCRDSMGRNVLHCVILNEYSDIAQMEY